MTTNDALISDVTEILLRVDSADVARIGMAIDASYDKQRIDELQSMIVAKGWSNGDAMSACVNVLCGMLAHMDHDRATAATVAILLVMDVTVPQFRDALEGGK